MTRALAIALAAALVGCAPKSSTPPAQSPSAAPAPEPVAGAAPAPAPAEKQRPIHEVVNEAVALLGDAATPAQIQQAIGLLMDAGRREPGNAMVRVNLGVAYHRAGQLFEAQREYQAAVGQDPSIGRAWLNLGAIQREQGKLDQAESSFRSGIRNAPEDLDLRVALIGLLRERGRNDDAVAAAKEALAVNANSVEVYNLLGLIWQEKGDLVLARFVYQKALTGIPGADKNAWLHLNLGWNHYLEGRKELAVDELKRALELDPYLVPALVNLSRIYLDDRNYQDTVPLLERARERAPNDAGVHLNLGIAYRGVGRYPDAEKEYRKALELDARNPAPLLDLGILFGDYVKNYDAAIASFQGYVDAGGPDTALATAWMAEVEKEKTRVEKRKQAEEDRKKREAERAERQKLLEEAERAEKNKKPEPDAPTDGGSAPPDGAPPPADGNNPWGGPG